MVTPSPPVPANRISSFCSSLASSASSPTSTSCASRSTSPRTTGALVVAWRAGEASAVTWPMASRRPGIWMPCRRGFGGGLSLKSSEKLETFGKLWRTHPTTQDNDRNTQAELMTRPSGGGKNIRTPHKCTNRPVKYTRKARKPNGSLPQFAPEKTCLKHFETKNQHRTQCISVSPHLARTP